MTSDFFTVVRVIDVKTAIAAQRLNLICQTKSHAAQISIIKMHELFVWASLLADIVIFHAFKIAEKERRSIFFVFFICLVRIHTQAPLE